MSAYTASVAGLLSNRYRYQKPHPNGTFQRSCFRHIRRALAPGTLEWVDAVELSVIVCNLYAL